MSGRAKVQTEMVTFRAPAGTKQELDIRARSEGYKDRSALILDKVGVSQETALSEGKSQGTRGGDGVQEPQSRGRSVVDASPGPSESAEGKDKLDRAHEAMLKAGATGRTVEDVARNLSRPLLTHAHAANCPCSICTKSG